MSKILFVLGAFCVNLWSSDLKPPPKPVEYLYGKGEHYVALQSYEGKWVAAHLGGGIGLAAVKPHVSIWETFRLFCHDSGCREVSIQASNDDWVACDPQGKIEANRKKIGPWERFQMEAHEGKYAFKCEHGSYWSIGVAFGGTLSATKEFSPSSLFRVKILKKGFYHRPHDEL